MKRLKQWEEEKSVLEEGLSAIAATQEWYTERMASLQEKLRFGPEAMGSPSSANSEAFQVRMIREMLKQICQELEYAQGII